MSGDAERLQRYRERLAGALRALAGAPQLAVSFDAEPARLDAHGAHLPSLLQVPDDWDSWRALADRLALRYRYPLPLSRPLPDTLAPLVESLWQARVEAIGARKWPGVASNLQSGLLDHCAAIQLQPTRWPLPERLRLIAHYHLKALALPEALQPAIACWETELAAIGIHLAILATVEDMPRRYAAAALHIARRLNESEPESHTSLQQRYKTRADKPQGASGRRRHSRSERLDAPDVPTGSAQLASYHIFSRAYDELLRPGDLATPDELGRLRRRLEIEAGSQRQLVASLARQLERLLRAPRPTGWRDLQEQGQLDPRRLHQLIITPGWPSPYRQRAARDQRDTVVSLLLDNSASMRGQRIQLAALCADIFTQSLERCGITVEILGFTTADWDGGAASAAWRDAGQPSHPGRIAARRHLLYKGADQPWQRMRNGLGLMLKEDLLKENIDGEALEWAARRLLARPERRRILIMLGDGVPHERATATANGEGYLRQHMRTVIERLQRHPGLELLAIGFGPSLQRNYSRALRLRNARDLALVLTQELARLLVPAERRRHRRSYTREGD